MSKIVDNLIAYRVLSMLVKPFPETDAYKLGIIDKNGNKLKNPETEQEKDSFDYLSRLTFNLKKLLNKLPGGESKLKNIVAALYLIKEQWHSKSDIDTISEEELNIILNSGIILAEETIMVRDFLNEDAVVAGGGGSVDSNQVSNATAPTTRTGELTSTDAPVIRKKKPSFFRRQSTKMINVNLNQGSL